MMKVSIIIPIYNVELYIEKCLHSVFNQTYKNLEVILVDDCGTDKSMEIAEQIITNYQESINIKTFHHLQNKGLSAARNTGVKEATGDYIYFLDSDDTLPSTAISNLIEKAQKYQNPDFVIGGIRTTGIEERIYPLLSNEYLDNNKKILEDYMLFKWNVMACNKLINRDFFIRNNLFFIEKIYHEDLYFSFRLALYANTMACCYNVSYLYLIRNNSITTNKSIKNYKDNLWIIQQNVEIIRNKENILNKSILYSYITETIYTLYLTLIIDKNPLILIDEKISITNELKNILQKNTSINCKWKVSSFFNRELILLSFHIQIKIFNIYAQIKKLN